MQSVSSRIWTRVAVSSSCNDNHYTTDTSLLYTVDADFGSWNKLHRIKKIKFASDKFWTCISYPMSLEFGWLDP